MQSCRHQAFQYATIAIAAAAVAMAVVLGLDLATGNTVGPLFAAAFSSILGVVFSIFVARAAAAGRIFSSDRVDGNSKLAAAVAVNPVTSADSAKTSRQYIRLDTMSRRYQHATTEKFAANVERDLKVAAIVRREQAIARAQVDHVASQISRAREVVNETSIYIASVQDKSRYIHDVATVINEMAERTNLLKANAASRAEQMGDDAWAFAAVESEVRRLATLTSAASEEIEKMIHEINNQAERAIGCMKSSTLPIVDPSTDADQDETRLRNTEPTEAFHR